MDDAHISDEPASDVVGYKKPPKKTQFQKGKSGNPAGRPCKKGFHLTFIDLLDEEVVIGFNGEKVKIPLKAAILKKLFFDCASGKQAAMKNFIEMMKQLTNLPPI